MNAFNIRVAGLVVCIYTKYRPADSLFSDFRCDDPADIEIHLSDRDMLHKCVPVSGKVFVKDTEVLKKVANALIEFDVVLFHGAVIAMGDSAYLFTAPSGTGKTTHIRHWLSRLPDAYVVNGDKPFIRFQDNELLPPLVCGSPWAGKEKLYTNTMVTLKGIICMRQAEDNYIREISFAEAFPFLLQQTYRPENEENMRKTIRLLQRLDGKVKFWRFNCNNFKDDCFDVSYNALVGGNLQR